MTRFFTWLLRVVIVTTGVQVYVALAATLLNKSENWAVVTTYCLCGVAGAILSDYIMVSDKKDNG